MAVPPGIRVIDTMIGLPSVERRDWYESMAPILRDEGSKTFEHPAGYMFKDTPKLEREPDSIDVLLHLMDRYGIEKGLVPVTLTDELHVRALAEHSDRLFGWRRRSCEAGSRLPGRGRCRPAPRAGRRRRGRRRTGSPSMATPARRPRRCRPARLVVR